MTKPNTPETLLSIGTFAKASYLSPKALRLYNELELLVLARIDQHTGYHYYSPDQLERAKLIALLRQFDLPLVFIRRVLEAPLKHSSQNYSVNTGYKPNKSMSSGVNWLITFLEHDKEMSK